ncbi:MAG: macro domain-containing protein [Calditrichaceae bacterium]
MSIEMRINESVLHLEKGDITAMSVDAIVNAANQHLILGGGVAGAISTKGGPSIQEECNRIGGTYVGGAVITGGGNLPVKKVIHAVGPKMGEGEEDTKLKNATMNSLILAETYGLESIAFPAISTGIFGYPVERCAEIMLSAAIGYLQRPTKIKDLYFCLWSDADYTVFQTTLESKMENL